MKISIKISSAPFAAGTFIQDNQNLNLTTNTLTFANSSNSSYHSNKELGVNLNYNLDSKKIENQKEKEQQKGISSMGYNSSSSLGIEASKTLATLGEGEIVVKDIENSDDLTRLNKDTNKIDRDLYSSKSGTSVDATLDTRLLTKEGREQIKKEYEEMPESISIVGKSLPDAKSDNPIESVIGTVWKWLGRGTLDVAPSNENNGGALGNVPIWFGVYDNLHELQGDKSSKNVYINGILNSQEDAMQGGRNLIGEDESYLNFYNPTRGVLGDLVEAGVDKWGSAIGMQTGISKQAEEYLKKEENLNVLMHSQGNEVAKQGALNSKDNGHTYKSYGAPMISDEKLQETFRVKNPEIDIEKNDGDYVSYPLNIFNPKTWSEPGHGTENYGASRKAKEQGAKK